MCGMASQSKSLSTPWTPATVSSWTPRSGTKQSLYHVVPDGHWSCSCDWKRPRRHHSPSEDTSVAAVEKQGDELYGWMGEVSRSRRMVMWVPVLFYIN